MDVKERVRKILGSCRGGSVGMRNLSIYICWMKRFCNYHVYLGAYTDSSGIDLIKNDVANFIERRDGYTCDPSDIFMLSGASDGIKVRCVKSKLYSNSKNNEM